MNCSKLVLSLSCLVGITLTSPLATAAPRGGGSHFSGGHNFVSGRPGMGSWSGHNWSGHNWSGHNWSGHNWNGQNWGNRNWNGHNWNNWHGNWHHGHNTVVFIGDFGFPGWWGWGWGYPYGYYGYPYGYYGYGYPYGDGYGYGGYGYGYGNYGYGNGYGYSYGSRSQSGSGSQYGSATRSRVAELQRRLSRAGYYRGSIDGVLGPQTRRAIRAYEQDHGYADAS
jgi:Putative peptidoglycan binding domain